MSKLKPCMNDMCIAFSTSYSGNCSWYPDNDHCNELYTTTKPESIYKKRWVRLKELIYERINIANYTKELLATEHAIIVGFLEVSARIEELEKELKE